MNKHDFCLLLLAQAREEARIKGVSPPKHITALSDGNGQFFMEAEGMEGRWVSACCSYEARAKLLRLLIDTSCTLDDDTAAVLGTMAEQLEEIDRQKPISTRSMGRAWVIMLAANVILQRLTSAQLANAVITRLRKVIERFDTGGVTQ